MSWPIVTLGNLVDVKGGKRLPKGESYHQSETKHPYIRVTDFINGSVSIEGLEYISEKTHNKIQRYTISKNDVYISIAGSIGIVGKIPPSLDGANLTENAAKLVIKDDQLLDQDFLIRFLSTHGQDQIQSKKKATSQPKLALFRIEEIEVPLPPLEEQKRIAAILDKADAIRQKRKQAIDLADEFLRSVFLDMFGDPVTNPKGWEVVELADVTHKVTDGTHKTPTYTSEGVPFLSAKNIKPWGLDWSDTKFVSTDEHNDLIRRCNPEKGDVLLSKSGSLGTPAIVEVDKEFSLFESAALFKLNKELIEPEYLFHYLRSNPTKYMMLRSTKGVAIKHLHLTDLRRLNILLPPKSLRLQFMEIASLVKNKVEKLNDAGSLSDDNFSALSQKAFSGQL
ncbi:restriction endonuclease subunit S [Vibrio sp. WXL210]|uniref:restriction endonuclease subunit S n=1 Tax=Vibrio sp. WXL210 TaxID=3450709 RepID=UPI003EC63ACA